MPTQSVNSITLFPLPHNAISRVKCPCNFRNCFFSCAENTLFIIVVSKGAVNSWGANPPYYSLFFEMFLAIFRHLFFLRNIPTMCFYFEKHTRVQEAGGRPSHAARSTNGNCHFSSEWLVPGYLIQVAT